jgi:hypothetical protein
VYAPNGVDPIYGANVYVPGAAVSPFPQGVDCNFCSGALSGSPIALTTSTVDGTFTLTGVPAGVNVPVVIQIGRWRRQIVVPSVPSCVSTPLPAAMTHLPRNQSEGDIPHVALVTGPADTVECTLRKIGIDDAEFGDPGGGGRVDLYVGDSPGASYSAATPVEDQLWGTQAAIDQYALVLFPCQGMEIDKTPAAQQVVINYANAGGVLYANHYQYVWLFDDAPFSGTAQWAPTMNANFSMDPETASIVTTFPRGLALADWLAVVGASTAQGQLTLQSLRNDLAGIVPPSLLWVVVHDPNYPSPVPMHNSFDAPVGAAPANQCGHVAFSDFHVEDTGTSGIPPGTTFPGECTQSPMTPQEKMFEFMIFDLGNCIYAEGMGP